MGNAIVLLWLAAVVAMIVLGEMLTRPHSGLPAAAGVDPKRPLVPGDRNWEKCPIPATRGPWTRWSVMQFRGLPQSWVAIFHFVAISASFVRTLRLVLVDTQRSPRARIAKN
jgi:hypothetical protein